MYTYIYIYIMYIYDYMIYKYNLQIYIYAHTHISPKTETKDTCEISRMCLEMLLQNNPKHVSMCCIILF